MKEITGKLFKSDMPADIFATGLVLLSSLQIQILWATSKWNNDEVSISLLRSIISWKGMPGFLYQTNE